MTRKGWLLFVTMSVVWGIPYFFIKIALQEVDPATIVFTRVCLAALVLVPIALFRNQWNVLRKRWLALLLLSVIQIVAPFLLIGYGEQHIASSLTSLLIAAEPLLVALLALRFDASERVHGMQLVGLVIGLLGVVVLLGFDVSGGVQRLLGAGLVLLAAASYSVSALSVKRPIIASLPSLGVVAAECAIATTLLFPVALTRLPSHVPSLPVIISLLILGLICTALAYVLFYALIAEVGASRSTVFTYVNPAVSVLLGVIVLGEQLNIVIITGFVLILIGSWLSTSVTLPLAVKRLVHRQRS